MEILFTSIESIIPIIVIIVLGYILQVRGWFSESFGSNLSRLIMNVALPVSIFVSVMKYLTLDKLISLSGGLLYTFAAFILGYIVAYIAVVVFKVRKGRRGTMINTFVNANTIFIGLPLNVALFGDQALPYFLIYYITNTISTWTLGVYLMTSDSKSGHSNKATKFDWKKLLPAPLVGFLVALVFLILRIPVPAFATNTLTYIGNIVTPLSLVYIGIVLAKAGLVALTWNEVDFDRGLLKTYRRFNTLSHKFVPPKNKTSIRIVPIDEECIKILRLLQTEQERANMELGIKNRYRMIFQHFGYIHSVPDIASVNKALSVLLNELNIYPIITTKGARHTYGSYLWHKGFDLGVIAKILGHRDISMLVEVYGHTLEEKIFEEFNQIRDVWKDCS